MTPSDLANIEHQARITAVALLIRDGILTREGGIDLLLDYLARQPQDALTRAVQPRYYEIARVFARRVQLEGLPYGEAEIGLAAAISFGAYDDLAMEQASKLLDTALRRLDRLREQVTDQVQRAISNPEPETLQPVCMEAIHAS